MNVSRYPSMSMESASFNTFSTGYDDEGTDAEELSLEESFHSTSTDSPSSVGASTGTESLTSFAEASAELDSLVEESVEFIESNRDDGAAPSPILTAHKQKLSIAKRFSRKLRMSSPLPSKKNPAVVNVDDGRDDAPEDRIHTEEERALDEESTDGEVKEDEESAFPTIPSMLHATPSRELLVDYVPQADELTHQTAPPINLHELKANLDKKGKKEIGALYDSIMNYEGNDGQFNAESDKEKVDCVLECYASIAGGSTLSSMPKEGSSAMRNDGKAAKDAMGAHGTTPTTGADNKKSGGVLKQLFSKKKKNAKNATNTDEDDQLIAAAHQSQNNHQMGETGSKARKGVKAVPAGGGVGMAMASKQNMMRSKSGDGSFENGVFFVGTASSGSSRQDYAPSATSQKSGSDTRRGRSATMKRSLLLDIKSASNDRRQARQRKTGRTINSKAGQGLLNRFKRGKESSTDADWGIDNIFSKASMEIEVTRDGSVQQPRAKKASTRKRFTPIRFSRSKLPSKEIPSEMTPRQELDAILGTSQDQRELDAILAGTASIDMSIKSKQSIRLDEMISNLSKEDKSVSEQDLLTLREQLLMRGGELYETLQVYANQAPAGIGQGANGTKWFQWGGALGTRTNTDVGSETDEEVVSVNNLSVAKSEASTGNKQTVGPPGDAQRGAPEGGEDTLLDMNSLISPLTNYLADVGDALVREEERDDVDYMHRARRSAYRPRKNRKSAGEIARVPKGEE